MPWYLGYTRKLRKQRMTLEIILTKTIRTVRSYQLQMNSYHQI